MFILNKVNAPVVQRLGRGSYIPNMGVRVSPGVPIMNNVMYDEVKG